MIHTHNLRGRMTHNAPLGAKGWFRTGGSAEKLYKAADLEDLQAFLSNNNDPIHIFGALSNTIIRDGGLEGTTIRLPRSFADITVEGDIITAGALALDANVAKAAADHGMGGVEFLSGIPGTIGGALRMNAGCYGTEMKDILIDCQALDSKGALHTLSPDQMGMSYRHTTVPADMIFISARLKTMQESTDIVHQRIKEIKEKREESQPIREQTGGSTFANPSTQDLQQAGFAPDTKVWQLIDRVGGRGLMVGGAQMSEKHCNFMINTGHATAADLENLGDEIRRRVAEETGIALRWEIRRIGNPI